MESNDFDYAVRKSHGSKRNVPVNVGASLSREEWLLQHRQDRFVRWCKNHPDQKLVFPVGSGRHRRSQNSNLSAAILNPVIVGRIDELQGLWDIYHNADVRSRESYVPFKPTVRSAERPGIVHMFAIKPLTDEQIARLSEANHQRWLASHESALIEMNKFKVMMLRHEREFLGADLNEVLSLPVLKKTLLDRLIRQRSKELASESPGLYGGSHPHVRAYLYSPYYGNVFIGAWILQIFSMGEKFHFTLVSPLNNVFPFQSGLDYPVAVLSGAQLVKLVMEATRVPYSGLAPLDFHYAPELFCRTAPMTRLLVQLLLVSAGVEPNPGPCVHDCKNAGLPHVRGVKTRVGHRFVVNCVYCLCVLDNIACEESRWYGDHPSKDVFKGICPDTLLGVPTPKPIIDVMPSDEIKQLLNKEHMSTSGRSDESVDREQVRKRKSRGKKSVAPEIVVQPKAQIASVVKTDDKKGSELVGHVMTDDENVAFLTSKLGWGVSLGEISVTQRTVVFENDQRVLANRDYKIARNDYAEVTLIYNPYFVYTKLRTTFYLFMMCAIMFTTHYLWFNATLYLLLADYNIHVPAWFVHGLLLIMASWLELRLAYVWIARDPYKRKVVKYLPHLITQLLLDFSRGCNQETVVASIRPKINRMANFPIHQRDADVVVLGSEMVAEFLISRQDFSIMEAACL